MIEQIQRWWRGEPPYTKDDLEPKQALESARKSLDRAVRTSTAVSRVVQSIQAEGQRNHFIELLYAVKH